MDWQGERNLQDHRLSSSGPTLGPVQTPSGYELRQIVEIIEAVLQEGYNEEDPKNSTAGVPVLSTLPLVRQLAECGPFSLLKNRKSNKN